MVSVVRGRPAAGTDQEVAPIAFLLIPIASGVSAGWAALPQGCVITGFGDSDAPMEIAARHRLVRPGSTLEILIVNGRDVRDGMHCHLEIESEFGPETVRARLQLARWTDHGTPRVLRFLVGHGLQKEFERPSTLGRYLAFASSWRAPARLLASFPEGHLAEIDVGLSGDRLSAYLADEDEVEEAGLRVLAGREHRSLMWIEGPLPTTLYLEHRGDLLEIGLAPAAADSDRNILRDWPSVLEALDRDAQAASAPFAEWAAPHLRRRASVRLDAAEIAVLAAVWVGPGQAAVFLESTGDVHGLNGFAVKEWRSDIQGAIDVHVDEPTSRILVTALGLGQLSNCLKLSFEHEGRSHTLWVRAVAAADPAAFSTVAAFWPLMRRNPALLAGVAYPVATEHLAEAQPRLLQSADWRPAGPSGRGEVVVISQGNPEALDRTLIGLALTLQGQGLSVRVVTMRPHNWERLALAMERLAGDFDLPMRLEAYPQDLPETLLIEAPLESGVRVVCRAGAVPVRSDWYDALLSDMRAGKAGLALGAARAPGAPRSRPDSATVRDWEGFRAVYPEPSAHVLEGRPIAAAALSSPGSRSEAGARVRTFEGAVLRRAVACLSAREPIVLSQHLAFAEAGLERPDDPLSVYADQRTLQVTLEQVSSSVRTNDRARKRAGRA